MWTVYELACFLSTLVVDVVPPCAHSATSSCAPIQLTVEVPQIQFFDVVGFTVFGLCLCNDKSVDVLVVKQGRFPLLSGCL